MIKGTRMIVITKNKIIARLLAVIAGCICIGAMFFICKNKSITAFSEYKKIIDTQITPSYNEQSEHVIEFSQAPIKLLKAYFVLGDFAAETEALPKTEEIPSEPLVKSESRKVDKGLQVANRTNIEVNPSEYLTLPLSFKIDDNGPQVLIMHTHTTESFSEEAYVPGAADRNTDETKNISAVGAAMTEIFNKNGIQTLHDATVHDYPVYNGSYQRAAATIQKNLDMYPSIKVVLDVHRDGITKADGTKVKMLTEIDGVPTAQVMLVVGTNATLSHDNWHENFKLAVQIQQSAIDMYPSLIRPIDLRQERFNEQMTAGSLIVEIGTNGNTLEEAVNGGICIAEAISAVLKK